MTEHLDARRDCRLIKRALDLGTTLIASGMHDPAMRVPSLHRECRTITTVRRIERRAEAHQIANGRRGFSDELADRALVAQSCTGIQRVAHMVLERIGGIEHTGQSALGPRGATSIEGVLGDDQGGANGPSGDRSGEAGRARAEHGDIDVALPRDIGRGKLERNLGGHRSLAGARRLACGDHPLDGEAGPVGDVARHLDLVGAVA